MELGGARSDLSPLLRLPPPPPPSDESLALRGGSEAAGDERAPRGDGRAEGRDDERAEGRAEGRANGRGERAERGEGAEGAEGSGKAVAVPVALTQSRSAAESSALYRTERKVPTHISRTISRSRLEGVKHEMLSGGVSDACLVGLFGSRLARLMECCVVG